MISQLKRNWKALKGGRPGSRFQGQYRRQNQSGGGAVKRVLRIVAGVVILLVGLFFLPAPGPGFIVVAIGGALLAREFESVARLLDAIEVRGRALAAASKRAWKRLVRSRRAASR